MIPTPFTYFFTLRLHDTDAAGRLFFAHLFRHAHDAFENLMTALGVPLDAMISAGQTLLPLIHAEADYRQPLSRRSSASAGDNCRNSSPFICDSLRFSQSSPSNRSDCSHHSLPNQRRRQRRDDLSPMLRTALTSFQHSAIPL
ncbi:acyl-CoA thioesterase [Chromatium okenii]|uniref:Uncharacterized protein n=1 Tax=Chromatium okenii TaxID=61644 RepID=A0A2S7XVX4_9GAMM|nr:acyl-CoA thioesterase [Chromatium okenii]PQJ97658.1 hypothetical protein CXB77_00255 [Chromatium okenii]